MKAFPGKSTTLPAPGQALPGRTSAAAVPAHHFVNRRPLAPPYPAGLTLAWFGMGCFWGAERLFWRLAGVYTTAVGYAGGQTPNPTYEEVCSGGTGHAEVVQVVFDPAMIRYQDLLATFWENHDPTQGMRQGNDLGTQYRSLIVAADAAQQRQAAASRERYAQALARQGWGPITTEIIAPVPFYFAGDDHQQYLGKHPGGYCGLKGTGVGCSGADAASR